MSETTDVEAGFRTYEKARMPRTAFVARRARHIGAVGQWQHPRLVKARDAIARIVLNHSRDLRFNPIYSYQG